MYVNSKFIILLSNALLSYFLFFTNNMLEHRLILCPSILLIFAVSSHPLFL